VSRILCVGRVYNGQMRTYMPSGAEHWSAKVEVEVRTQSTVGVFGDHVPSFWKYMISMLMPRYPFVFRADQSGFPL